ncbi:MAG: hypothetical protein AAFX99_14395 [Myxococcota bacterium]
MAKMSKREIEQRMNAVHARYTFRFAGHPRATRDLTELDSILSDTKNLVKKTRSLQRHTSQELRQTLDERLELYQNERRAILELVARGPEVRQASMLGSTANIIHAHYRRHFAGMSRSTRDTALLDDMHTQMLALRDDMENLRQNYDDESLQRDIEVVEGHLELYRTEREAILETQRSGTPQEQADLLAALANAQFEVYRTHFAGRERVTRRPELLERLRTMLNQLLDRMRELKSNGLQSSTHDTNIRVVRERMEVYAEELEAVQIARSRANVTDLVLNLGHAANQEMNTYRENFAGKDRASRDLALLSGICDRLGEIERQMRTIDQEHPGTSSTNNRNLHLVRDHIRVYEAEYDRIAEAQADAQN